MSKLLNNEKNILLQLNLISSEMLDYNAERATFENWIPFNFMLNVENGMLTYIFENNETFTQLEIEELIQNIEKVCNDNMYSEYSFTPLENYFELKIENLFEDDLLEMEWWFDKGILSEGKNYGFSEGVKFNVIKTDLLIFVRALREELNVLISTKEIL